ncbi:MAG: ribonuclease III [Thermodesulfovibrionales bacterium]|nr:ribonuclease III [Thermodesulfovibrionales bacterium]
MRQYDITELQTSLGYGFRDKSLLEEALTHKSFHYENPKAAAEHNERLEFLGDSVLALVVIRHLFNLKDRLSEAVMSKIKSHIVKGSVLSEIAKEISLGNYLRVGKGEEESGGRHKKSLTSDALEAVIGAVYMDGGMEEASAVILKLFTGRIEAIIESGDFIDHKTRLQEETQMRFGVLPDYRITGTEGKEHKRIFTVEVYIGGRHSGSGTGRTKKEAESLAAKEALEGLSAG